MDNSNDETVSLFEQYICRHARIHQAVVVEFVVCPKCSSQGYTVHTWDETVPCPACQHRIASKVPRRTQPGEVTFQHLKLALETLIGCYSVSPLNGFSSVVEWNAFTPECRDAITRNISAAAVAVLKQVDNLAVAFAAKGE